MQQFPAPLTERLASKGCIVVRRDDSGNVSAIALSTSALDWVPVVAVASPNLQFTTVSPTTLLKSSTLDLLLALHREGFEPADDPQPWSPATQNCYRLQSMHGTKLYFIALLFRNEIIHRGAMCIFHRQPAKYYKLLLTLEKLDVMNDENMETAKLDALHNNESLHAPLCDVSSAVEGGSGDDSHCDDSNYDHNSHELRDLNMILPVQLQERAAEQHALRSYRCPSSSAWVHFDNYSHSSGNLRAYIVCQTHPACTKHCQVITRGSRKAAIAFCLAWNAWGVNLEREEHSCQVPPESFVEQAMLDLPESCT